MHCFVKTGDIVSSENLPVISFYAGTVMTLIYAQTYTHIFNHTHSCACSSFKLGGWLGRKEAADFTRIEG